MKYGFESPKDWSPIGNIPGIPIWPKFVQGYLETALWSSIDEDGKEFDSKYDITDFKPSAVSQAIEDCNDFIAKNREDLESVGDDFRNGHDFWLTRNHHGAGFWDRGYGQAGKRLTASAHTYSEIHPYIGDGGGLYLG